MGLHEILPRALPHHEHAAAVAVAVDAVDRNRVQLQPLHGGFYIEGDHLQGGPVGAAPDGGILQQEIAPAWPGHPLQQGRPRHEALHQVAIRGVDVRLQRFQPLLAQGIRQAPRLAVGAAVHGHHRMQLEAAQGHRLALYAGYGIQQGARPRQLGLAQEKHTAFAPHQRAQRPLGAGEPEFQFYPARRIAPVAGEEKTVEALCCHGHRQIDNGAGLGGRSGLSYSPNFPVSP